MRRLLHCTLSLRQRLAVDVADRKVVAGQTIVHHQGIAVQDRALQHGDVFQHLIQLHGPCHACFQTVIVLQPVLNPAQRNILIKHRPDYPGAFQRTAVLFKGSRPCHAKGRAECDRRCVSAAVVQHFFLTAEQVKCTGKKARLRAVALQQAAIGIITPCINVAAALDQLRKQLHILKNIHRIPLFYTSIPQKSGCHTDSH